MAAYHSDEILDGGSLPLRYAAFSLLPQGGRLARQGHQGHHPGALVRQGRDVRLLNARGVRRRAPAAARVGEAVPRQARAGLPRHRRGRRATSASRRSGSSTARPGSRPRAGTASSPPPRTAPSSRPAASTPGRATTPTASRSSARWRRSTARSARSPARSWRSWRPISRRTARSVCRRRCGPGSAGARSSSRSPGERLEAAADRARHRRHPAQVGRRRRHHARGDLARGLPRRTPLRSTPVPTSSWRVAARRTALTRIADALDLHVEGESGSGSSPATARSCSGTRPSR